ncbi:MAG TPA: hypothetical protein VFU27_00160 [Terriglobales bacterium]|nr:hypothetical protein [Terriglobales bacterium]
MKRRIAVWALLGFLISAGWVLYSLSAFPSPIGHIGSVTWNLAVVSQPIAFASFHFHFGIKFYWVVLVNAATYALVGLMVEMLRRQLRHAT